MWRSTIVSTLTIFCITVIPVTRSQIDDDNAMGYSMPAKRIKTPQLAVIEATCDASGMQVTIQFDMPFNGIIYSKGSYYTQGCTFILPNGNLQQYTFNIPVDACGTQSGNDDTKSPPVRYIENTIIMQNDAMYQQQSDTARQVRCNWNTNFHNTIKFTPFHVDMRKAIGVNFNGNDVTTAMSVQVGRGPFAPVIREALVQIGDTLTLVIYLQTKDVGLEIQVLDCTATDGRNRNAIKLTDENGCVLKDKLISNWMTTRETQNSAAEIAYAYLTAFKFPDDMTVNIQCNIAVCKGGCPVTPCGGLSYGEVPPAPEIPEDNTRLHRRTTPIPEELGYGLRTLPFIITKTTRTTTTTEEEDQGYGKVVTPAPTTIGTTTTRRTTTTSTTSYVPPKRTIPPYGEETEETPSFRVTFSPATTRPAPRRRTVFDRRRRAIDDDPRVQGQIPVSSSIRVISPADVSSPNASILRLSSAEQASLQNTLCINTALFSVIIAVLFALLVASCVTSALLCLRQRSISKKEREICDYGNPMYPTH